MNILYIVECPATGVGRHLVDLIDGARAHGHTVEVIYSPAREDALFIRARDRLGTDGVRFTAVAMRREPGPWDLGALRAIRRHIRRSGPYDVIHGHSSKGGMMARLAAIGSTARVVYTPHAISTLDPTLSGLKRRIYHAGEWTLARLTDVLIAVSTHEGEHMRRLGIPARKIAVVLNAVEPPEGAPREAARRELGLRDDQLAVGFVGRLGPHKAIDVMVDAFARVWRDRPGARLIVIGDGEQTGTAKAQADAAGCGAAVSWLGARDALPYYRAFDLLAQPSRYEGLSYSLLEAAGTGLPVVATDVGGTRDVIEHGVNGIIVPRVGDADAFARELRALMENPAALAGMASAAGRAIRHGGVARMVAETLALYRQHAFEENER
jgi:glycosyltransferase involved in cell wall biosynthesis